MPIRVTFARLCRETRARLGLTQQHLADTVGVTRGYIAKVETTKANPTFDLAERIAVALDLGVDIVVRLPAVIGDWRHRDFIHARCSEYVERRLQRVGWQTAREVEIVQSRSHGWIDLLAFDPASGILLVIEIKTRLDDLGSIERQLGWYERSAFDVAHRLGWRPRRVIGWLVVLASDEVDRAITQNRDLLARSFPARARSMLDLVASEKTRLRTRSRDGRSDEQAARLAADHSSRWPSVLGAVSGLRRRSTAARRLTACTPVKTS